MPKVPYLLYSSQNNHRWLEEEFPGLVGALGMTFFSPLSLVPVAEHPFSDPNNGLQRAQSASAKRPT